MDSLSIRHKPVRLLIFSQDILQNWSLCYRYQVQNFAQRKERHTAQ